MPLRSRCLDLVGVDCFQALGIKRYTLGARSMSLRSAVGHTVQNDFVN